MDNSVLDGHDTPHTCAHCNFIIYNAAEQQRKCLQDGTGSGMLGRVLPSLDIDTDAVVRGAQQGCPFLSMLVANGRRIKYVDGEVTFRDGFRDDQVSESEPEATGADHAVLRIPRFDFDHRDPGVYADVTRVWLYGGRSAVITAEICELKPKTIP